MIAWLRAFVRLHFCSPSLAAQGRCPCRRCGIMRADVAVMLANERDAAREALAYVKECDWRKRQRAASLVGWLRRDNARLANDLAQVRDELLRERAEVERLQRIIISAPPKHRGLLVEIINNG